MAMRFRGILIVAAGALALTACAGTPVDLGPTLAPPVGSDELAFRYSLTTSPVPPNSAFEVPEMSVYGDGLVVRSAADPGGSLGQAWPTLVQQRLTPTGVARLLDGAREAGLATATDYGAPDIPDAPISTFEVPGRVTSVVLVSDSGPSLSGSQQEARDRLRAFADGLTNLDAWLGDDISAQEPYAYTRVAVLVVAHEPAPGTPTRTWPFGDLAQGGELVEQGRCLTLADDQVEAAREAAADASPSTSWLSGEGAYHLTFRPLLPNEADCRAVSS